MLRWHPVFIACALLSAGCGEPSAEEPHLLRCGSARIVAMAPNIAEILFALGLSNEVAGVSRFTAYPPEAAAKPSVGGTYDPNWEMIVALQPDLVIGLDSQEEIEAQLKQLDIRFLGVAHERVDEIMQSILAIGETCGAEAEAQELFQGLEKQLAVFSNVWKNPPPVSAFGEASAARPGEPLCWNDGSAEGVALPNNAELDGGANRPGEPTDKPRVLVCVGHDETLSRMYVAARNTFYDDLINLAGGTNACETDTVKYPEISPESLRVMRPDVVIDILPNIGNFSSKVWKPYRAVLMTNSYASIPGPRFVLLLEDLIGALHE